MSCTFIFPIYLLSLVLILIKSDRRDALKSIMAILGSVIPVRPQFFDSLASLDSLKLEGSLYIDLSIIASIPANLISELSYGDIAITVMVNSFEATASFGSTAFSIELPITLPSERNDKNIDFSMNDASFMADIFVKLLDPIDVVQFFLEDNQDSSFAGLDYGGSFEAILPLSVGTADVQIGVDLTISASDLFILNPVFDFSIDLCDLSDVLMELFDQVKVRILEVLDTPFADLDITVNIGNISDSLMIRVENALAKFTEGLNLAMSTVDCLPSLQPSSQVSSHYH